MGTNVRSVDTRRYDMRRRLVFAVVLGLALLLFVLGRFDGYRAFAANLTLDPTSSEPGSTLVASGSGFGANQTVAFFFDQEGDGPTLPQDYVGLSGTDATGSFSGAEFQVPDDATAGPASASLPATSNLAATS